MSKPADEMARLRFCTALDRNFSIVAAAGSGKTRALTDRIVAIARSAHALEWLPQLVVVTYTNRAANEMQQRARENILTAELEGKILGAFNRAFFGTIHSYCVKLLNAYGHFLGLPSQLELVTDDDDLWNDFVQRQEVLGRALSTESRAVLLRYVEARRLLELARRGGIAEDVAFDNDLCPDVDIAPLLRYQPKGSSVENISRTQARLREWDRARLASAEFFPLPLRGSTARDFVALWQEAFGPFRDWLSRAALCVAAEVERDYRAYRLTKGTLTYSDQVSLALQLFENPEAARRIRERNYRIILDEAQDTGSAQFGVLLETTRPPEASGFWPNESADPPRPGHFCMVGDFQQSIFRQHADLPHYRAVHDALVAAPGGETVEFSVTFRLDQKSIDFVNESFRAILNDRDGQVNFVEMQPRPSVLPGQILRVDFSPPEFPPREPVRRKAAWEARQLAAWICAAGLKNLRAKSWRDVAILCPRKLWFPPLRDALLREGLKVEVQSETEIKGNNPAYAWLTALLVVMANPHDTYEIVGVLREVFGISDHDLAAFGKGEGWRFDLRRKQEGDDPVSRKLQLLGRIRAGIALQPLFTAVQEVIKTTQLRERLHTLPPTDFTNLDDELDALLASAGRAEADGSSLFEFARFLRDDFETVREPRATQNEAAIQLITSHKAKGSEWQAVILPFLTREVDSRADNFPRLTTDPITRAQRILFDKEEITDEMEAETKMVERQEMERLLYVALTRAKHTLVLSCAPGLYATARNPQPDKSQIKWLRCEGGGCNESIFAQLSDEARSCAKTTGQQEKNAQAQSDAQKVFQLPSVPRSTARRAHDFVRQINPSGFAEEFERADLTAAIEAQEKPASAGAFDNAATRYGHWWHALVQGLDWKMPAADWEKSFKRALLTAPDEQRATTEWNLFRSRSEDLRRHFAGGKFVVHSEVPFALKINRATALEGIIDLAILEVDGGRGLIVDWKTNRVKQGDEKKLREIYLSQLAAYWKSSTELTGLRMEAALYSTSAGVLLFYETQELEDEWARLRDLPAMDLRAAVVRE